MARLNPGDGQRSLAHERRWLRRRLQRSEVFRDEIMAYASRLVQAGTMVELHVRSGARHGSERMAPDAEVSLAGIAARKSYLRRAVRTI